MKWPKYEEKIEIGVGGGGLEKLGALQLMSPIANGWLRPWAETMLLTRC